MVTPTHIEGHILHIGTSNIFHMIQPFMNVFWNISQKILWNRKMTPYIIQLSLLDSTFIAASNSIVKFRSNCSLRRPGGYYLLTVECSSIPLPNEK